MAVPRTNRRMSAQSNSRAAAIVDTSPLTLTLSLGSSDALYPNSQATRARNLKLQTLGFLYTPIPDTDSDVPLGPRAAAFFGEVNASTSLAQKLDQRVVVMNGNTEEYRLPLRDERAKIRMPGGYCVLPADINHSLYGDEPVPNQSWRTAAENAVLRANPYMKMLPIVIHAQQLNTRGQPVGAPNKVVRVELIPPDPEPAPTGNRAIRAVPHPNAHIYAQTRTVPQLRLVIDEQTHQPRAADDGARSPATYIQRARQRWAGPAGDPQAGNTHRTFNGRVGLPWAYVPATPPAPAPGQPPAPEPRPFWGAPLPMTLARTGTRPNTVEVTTDQNGEAVVILMVSTIGGDAYKLRATCDRPPNAQGGYEPFETGTMVIWRTLRLRYMRWEYPGSASAEERARCGGETLENFFTTPAIADELSKAYIEVEPALSGPETMSATEWRNAANFAKERLLANLSLMGQGPLEAHTPRWGVTPTPGTPPGYTETSETQNLKNALLPTNDDNPTAGFIRFARLSVCKTELGSRIPAALNDQFTTRATTLLSSNPGSNLATLIANQREDWILTALRNIQDAMGFGMIAYFTEAKPGTVLLVQAPATSSLRSLTRLPLPAPDDGSPAPAFVPGADDLPAANIFGHSGTATPSRGAIVAYANGEYYPRNATHPNLPKIAQTPTMNALHELGHVLYLRHQYTDDREAQSNHPHLDEHDNHDLCIMGYTIPDQNAATIDFCGRCLLHLRGWNTGPLPVNGTRLPRTERFDQQL
ncbi:MAG: hypothetical protein U0271_22150 [Polyangiaceae bacterium]